MIINCRIPLKIVFEEKWHFLQELETHIVAITNKSCFLCSTLFVEINASCGDKKDGVLKIGDAASSERI